MDDDGDQYVYAALKKHYGWDREKSSSQNNTLAFSQKSGILC
jgi:hypothetical protein